MLLREKCVSLLENELHGWDMVAKYTSSIMDHGTTFQHRLYIVFINCNYMENITERNWYNLHRIQTLHQHASMLKFGMYIWP